MTHPIDPSPSPPQDGLPPSRIAFERLRERTDELELIVSGLLAFALLTVPARLFEAWAGAAVHLDGLFWQALWLGFMVSAGFSYTLAIAFVVHLAIRGYWIGLIGLKSTFPKGIRWDAIPLMGAVSRAYHRALVGDLGDAIDRADRAASILFAAAILAGMMLAWLGVMYMLVISLAGLVGLALGDPARIALGVLIAVGAVFLLISSLPMLLDRLATRRQAAGAPSPRLERAARWSFRIYGMIFPQRLVSPVLLTLQSNLSRRAFLPVFYVVVMAALALGALQVVGSRSFALFNRYDVLTGEAIEYGMQGAHYESLRSDADRLLMFPMIPSDRIAETHLRLFIPHRPLRDNAPMREACPALDGGHNAARGAAASAAAVRCLSSLWSVTLDGEAVAVDDFLPMERRDLGMRGLVGYLPIEALAPGRHDLHLRWNPDGIGDGPQRDIEYVIPFWFTPGIDQPPRR